MQVAIFLPNVENFTKKLHGKNILGNSHSPQILKKLLLVFSHSGHIYYPVLEPDEYCGIIWTYQAAKRDIFLIIQFLGRLDIR